tara:strand:+ start:135 stop:359 length:225 start_codon:yes stop_codon:yes gene_type:complete
MSKDRKQYIDDDFTLKIAEKHKEQDYHKKAEGSSDDEKEDLPFLPFRFTATGAPNLRLQSTSQNYKTFVGKSKI